MKPYWTAKMKLFVFLLALLALSSAAPWDKKKQPSDKNLERRIHGIGRNGSVSTSWASAVSKKNKTSRPSSFSAEKYPLLWFTSRGSVPSGAIRIYNSYARRYDFVCSYRCFVGFYNPRLGGYCHYPFAGKEKLGTPFQILVRVDYSTFLTWKSGSGGAVPKNSVRSCSSGGLYVGKNNYGLGTVSAGWKGIVIPLRGQARWFPSYRVLTVN